jgi:SAM-dependent methyltransferase
MTFRLSEFFLAKPKVYSKVMKLISRRDGDLYIANFLAVEPSQRILDIGCGPANILDHLSGVEYTGIDISDKYIASARRKFQDKAVFHCTTVEDFPEFDRGSFDRILLLGVQHHLTDEILDSLLERIAGLLSPTGRLITHDPVYVIGQNPIARFLVNRDRGQFVRFQSEYEKLIPESLTIESCHVKTDMLRLPYSILFQDIRIKQSL